VVIVRDVLEAVRTLWWSGRKGDLIKDPLGVLAPLGGSSFKLDARKSWTAIDAGYSPDDQKHLVEASPVVEILGAIGLEHARPEVSEDGRVRYGIWSGRLPPVLARPALGGLSVGVPIRIFEFSLAPSGQNKLVTFAEEVTP
jgi:CRISPR-associated protein Csx14